MGRAERSGSPRRPRARPHRSMAGLVLCCWALRSSSECVTNGKGSGSAGSLTSDTYFSRRAVSSPSQRFVHGFHRERLGVELATPLDKLVVLLVLGVPDRLGEFHV